MEESDEYATVETVDDGIEQTGSSAPHSDISSQSTTSLVHETLHFLSANGWFIIFASVVLYIVWKRFLQEKLEGLTVSSRTAGSSMSPDEILARQEAVELARRKLQEQYDLKAQEFAIKQKEKEEKLRQQKLQELEKYGPGLGCTNKTKAPQSTPDTSEASLLKRKKEKSKLKPEYNPLMGGDSSGLCYRPARRGGGAGGG